MTTVLIVEDNYVLAAELELALAGAGHTVIGKAPSFEAVVRIVASGAPEVALIDHRLKGPRDGVAVAQHLRKLGTKIIYATAEAQHVRLVNGEAAEILSKPYSEKELICAVARVVKSAEQHG
jgi:DNA-binding response OmpR family regulator